MDVLDLPVPQTMGLVAGGLDLVLDGQRHVQRSWRDGIDEQLAHGGIYLGAGDAPAQGFGVAAAAAQAHVARGERAPSPARSAPPVLRWPHGGRGSSHPRSRA